MTNLEAKALERQATAKKRKETEKEFIRLVYRGNAYCRPCPPCEVKVTTPLPQGYLVAQYARRGRLSLRFAQRRGLPIP